MKKTILFIFCVLAFTGIGVTAANGQNGRKSVSGTEVTGTFRHRFTGRFKGSSSDIKILALGKNRLHIAMDLIYPYRMRNGELMANTGVLDGKAAIMGDKAVYESKQFGTCKITIKFVQPGMIKVSQVGSDSDCGFGHNVTAAGTYRKISSKKPKFDKNK